VTAQGIQNFVEEQLDVTHQLGRVDNVVVQLFSADFQDFCVVNGHELVQQHRHLRRSSRCPFPRPDAALVSARRANTYV
jgi:hypothetical protein